MQFNKLFLSLFMFVFSCDIETPNRDEKNTKNVYAVYSMKRLFKEPTPSMFKVPFSGEKIDIATILNTSPFGKKYGTFPKENLSVDSLAVNDSIIAINYECYNLPFKYYSHKKIGVVYMVKSDLIHDNYIKLDSHTKYNSRLIDSIVNVCKLNYNQSTKINLQDYFE